jgi:hypothetical protein
MAIRQAVINPGSSSWWLLSLTPFLYFEKVRASSADLQSVLEQEGKSAYHDAAAQVLAALQRHTGKDILSSDSSLPSRGRSREILDQARQTSKELVLHAARWSPSTPTLARPSELKTVMVNAYREWIRYNRKKAALLPHGDPLREELATKQIPRWSSILQRLTATTPRCIPELLENDQDLFQVLADVVRNAILLTSIAEKRHEKTFDSLAREFLPAVELVERIRIFGNAALSDGPARFDLLVRLHELRVQNIARNTTNLIQKPDSIVIQALRERDRFSVLRKRLAELDEIITSMKAPEEQWLKEAISLAKETHKEVSRIDRLGNAFMWLSGAYVLSEWLTGVDPLISKVIKSVLVNPITSKAIRDTFIDIHLAHKKFGPGATSAMAAVRDYIAVRPIIEAQSNRRRAATYEFWV